ncbi:MAG: IS630 family transposase [Phycisphaeraceae bacterium]|nr:IS630 family transposase [Phycisphaeraceae bacterium]
MQDARPRTRLRVLFQDEARFGQQGTLTTVWAPAGSRPTVIRQNGRRSIWVFAAVEPASGWSMAMVARHANTESMQTFLDRTASHIRPREHAVMILDGAGWHCSKELRWPKRITPLFLPPYSPELNPVERLWLWFRNNDWSNRVFEDEEALIAAARESHRRLTRARVRSVCRASWITPEEHL